MAEVDYQMALLLQYRFQQEHKRKENTDSDLQLALELQEQFKTEFEVERPSNNLVYKAPNVNKSKCLVDPSWEVIDPTPDIHVLFITFNKKFFWDQLGSVTVSWSKRMTTCAGICSYQGRGGMCSITLSEPLLKLRPRKDLVETLLHEMIHAYLFVTNNNRDRDGHGPEFHKHMYRINAEAGTNITVYHDFHDEVKLYQQHWWRCDGPCQQRRPYFGMIRRATNRAPGPNDRWWDEHMRNCGGTFIKVKSPDKPAKADKETTKKKKDPPKETSPKPDIRNYITSTSKLPNNNQSNKENISRSNPSENNVRTIPNTTHKTSAVGNVIPSKTSNIFGFTNLSGGKNNPKAAGVKGAVKNAGSSTFVVTKKGNQSTTEPNQSVHKPSTSTSDILPFSGRGRALSSSSLDNKDYSTVRDHWLKKFDNNPQRTGVKRLSDSSPGPSSQKLTKLDNSDGAERGKVECPVCSKKIQPEELNGHLDACLEPSTDDMKECVICGKEMSNRDLQKHIPDCSARNFSDDFEDVIEPSNLTCPKLVDSITDPKDKPTCVVSVSIDLTSDDDKETKDCPVCKKALSTEEYGEHVQMCLLSMCDEFDNVYDESMKDAKTPCLACGKNILKSELDSHLEDCMSMSNVFDTSDVLVEDDDGTGESTGDESGKLDESRYNCPFCLKLVLENEMQAHLARCLIPEDVLNDKFPE